MNIEILEFLGSGAFWKVERALITEGYYVNQKTYKQIAIKTSILGDAEENINIYNKIKEADLPTLAFYQIDNFNGKEVIFAEDINEDVNTEDIIYVSPNTARNIQSEKIKLALALTGQKANIKQDPKHESHLKGNKLSRIDNYEELIQIIYRDMESASKHKLGMCEDAFFFGVNITDKIVLNYKLADFDNILINQLKYSDDLVFRNTLTMLNSLGEFYDNFVDENKLTNEQRENIGNRISLLRGNIDKLGNSNNRTVNAH